MNDVLATKCSNIFESVMTSPLGECVISYFEKNWQTQQNTKAVMEIRDNLEERKYDSPQAFFDDIKQRFESIARDLGESSDIGLSLLTLVQLVEDAMAPLFAAGEKFDITELDGIIAEFKGVAEGLPNNLEEFKAQLDAKGEPMPEFPCVFERAAELGLDRGDLDVQAIYQDVLSLKSDKELEKIVDIVSRYETIYSHVNDVIDIDLAHCHPYTLRLILKYITESRENK